MKKYIIKSAKNNIALEDLVNRAIEEGYVPQGGVQNDGAYFHQAMVLGKKDEENPQYRQAANLQQTNPQSINSAPIAPTSAAGE